jgi:Family of unknown function (DUF6572)
MTEPYEPRGVENPKIVDLVSADPESGEVVLAILEGRPWTGGEEQLRQLEDKLNAYFGYVLDGFLVRDYPDYEGMPVAIRLDCVAEPGPAERPFLGAAAHFSAAHGLRFEVRVVADPFAKKAPWEAAPGSEALGKV